MLLRSGKSYAYTPMVRKRTNQKTKVTKNVKKYVKKAINKNQELKEYKQQGVSTTGTGLTINTWSSVELLELANGAQEGQRIGDKIRISPFYCATTITFDDETFASLTNAGATCNRQCRVIVVQLKRGFTIADVIAELPTDTVTAPLSVEDITRRCYILADRKYDESPNKLIMSTTNIMSPPENKHITFNLKPKITNLVWDSASGNVAPDIQGALYMLYLFTSTVTPIAGNNVVTVQNTPDVRVPYRDA